jgi:hypothetical protein
MVAILLSALLPVLPLFVSAPAQAPQGEQVLAEWRFDRGLQGWQPNRNFHIRQDGGALAIESNGTDPILVGPDIHVDTRDGDVLEVRLSASRSGEIRWFWRHSKVGRYEGFSENEARTVPIAESTELRTYRTRVFWADDRSETAVAGVRRPVSGIRFDLPEGAPGKYRIASIRIVRPAEGEILKTRWAFDGRSVVGEPRVDIARQAPPETHAVSTDYTIAMWYFAAWEPEYTWDGWKQVSERSPWRIPLLYDSSDAAMEYNGIRFYRSSTPRAVDWHVHWMREHAVNLMLWDWYPQTRDDGSFDPTIFSNRALELGFLGKAVVGGPPVATNRFVGKIQFATMWTNHQPFDKIGKGLIHYIVDQFFSQPNYYKIDGKPLLPLWSPRDLEQAAGGAARAHAVLDELRAYARERGFPGVFIAAVNQVETRARARELGIDGVMAYNTLSSGGFDSELRKQGTKVVEDRLEDFRTQTLPGHEKIWKRLTREFGPDYLLATTPMQNWEPTDRPFSPVIENLTPDYYCEMLRRARGFIAANGLRKFVSVEAFNEWLEGSYVEPSTQWGFGFLNAIRDAFANSSTP